HGVPHHQKKSGEAEITDDPQLVIQLRGLLVVDLTPSFSRALKNLLAQKGVVTVAGGHRELGQRRSHPGETEIALRCDSLALLQSSFAPLPACGHFFGGCETPLAVRMQQPARERVVDRRIVTKSGEDVVHEPAAVVDVACLLTNHPRHFVTLGQLDQRGGERRLVATRVMQLHFDRQPVTEDFAPPAERALRASVITSAETGCDRPGRRTGQHLQSFTPLRYLLPRDARASARLLAISLPPCRELTDARPGDERGQIVEAFFRPSQEGGGTSIDHELGTDYRLHILPARFESESNYSSEIRGVGNPDGAVAERCRARGQRFRRGAAVAEREGGTCFQLDESHNWSIPEQRPNTREKWYGDGTGARLETATERVPDVSSVVASD